MALIQQDRRDLVTPSPVFYGLVALVVALGVALWNEIEFGGVTLFLFVVAGWILSLAFHEFGHAVVAYIGGDRSVVDKGYLTLDVRKYVDMKTSLLFPILILVLGGIGLPGGAVWINTRAIKSPMMQSLMSAAGPAASGICALICLVPIRLGWIDGQTHRSFLLGLAFLGAIQVIAMIFNLVPVPGLDGYGIIDPHLSPQTRRSLAPVRQYGIMVFIAAIWFVPSVRDAFWGITDVFTEAIGGTDIPRLRSDGFRAFQFWENR